MMENSSITAFVNLTSIFNSTQLFGCKTTSCSLSDYSNIGTRRSLAEDGEIPIIKESDSKEGIRSILRSQCCLVP